MKNTTKFILIVLFVFIDINANGQSVFVKGGLSLARISFADRDNTSYRKGDKPKVGFHLGISYEKKISDMFFFEFGPMLHLKGVTDPRASADRINVAYLDIPILVKGYFEYNDDIIIYNTLGPYLGFGLLGRSSNRTIDWGKNIERFDFGLSLGIGVDFKGKQVGLAYDFSLLNNATHASWGAEFKHRVVRLSLGYKFK